MRTPLHASLARRRFLQRLPALGLLSALPVLAGAQQLNPFAGITSVEVFCNSAMLIEPVAGPPFRQVIYRMDAMEQLRRQLNARLPKGGEQAARAWLLANQAQIKRAFAPAAADLANALNRARYYRIDRLPAIVINGRGVVYGITNVAEAIARYRAHLQGRH
jgi:integrating conjugative element protein (TIGR03757 family)